MPQFVVVEGLRAVGKSTVAPLLAAELSATWVTVPTLLTDLRAHIDEVDLMARLHFWMMCDYAVSAKAREHLAAGSSVVVESYFYRTLATHAAMDASVLPRVDWGSATVPDLAVLLTLDEAVRQRRLTERRRLVSESRWARLEEVRVDVAWRTYESFGLAQVDTDGLDPREVAARIGDELRGKGDLTCSTR